MLELTDQTGLVVKRISLQLRTNIQPHQSYLYTLRSAVYMLELRKILKKKDCYFIFKGTDLVYQFCLLESVPRTNSYSRDLQVTSGPFHSVQNSGNFG